MQLTPVGDLCSTVQRFYPKLIFFVPKSHQIMSTVNITNVRYLLSRFFFLPSNLWLCHKLSCICFYASKLMKTRKLDSFMYIRYNRELTF